MSSFRRLASALVLFSIAAYVQAFQVSPGPSCTGTGPCSYTAADGTFVSGNCAPDGVCADNGASCTTDDNCYNSCGGGVCGGAGASCNSQDPFTTGQIAVACDTPEYMCSSNGGSGTCMQQASGGGRRRAVHNTSEKPRGELKCRISSETVCYKNGMATCFDLMSDFSNCGACGNSCGDVDGADAVSCVDGMCQIGKCRYGWKFVDGECVRPAGFNSQIQRRRQASHK